MKRNIEKETKLVGDNLDTKYNVCCDNTRAYPDPTYVKSKYNDVRNKVLYVNNIGYVVGKDIKDIDDSYIDNIKVMPSYTLKDFYDSDLRLYSETQANLDFQKIHDEISGLTKLVDDKLVSFTYFSTTNDDPNGVNIKTYTSNGGSNITVEQYENRYQWECKVIKHVNGKYYLYADYWLYKKANIRVPSSGSYGGINVTLTSFNETISNYLLTTLKAQYGTKYQNLLLQFDSNIVKNFNMSGWGGSPSTPGTNEPLIPYTESYSIVQAEDSNIFKGVQPTAGTDLNSFSLVFTGTVRCLITFNE